MILTVEPIGNTALGMDVVDEVVFFLPVSRPTATTARYIRPSSLITPGSEMLWNDDSEILWNDDSVIEWNE